MTCKYFGCEKIAEYPYPCCSMHHGMKFNSEKGLLESAREYGMEEVSDWPLEKLIHYSRYI